MTRGAISMLKTMTVLPVAGLLAFSATGSASPAHRHYSYNYIWLDAKNNIVGQHVRYCNAVEKAGGQLSGDSLLVVRGSCGTLVMNCMVNSNSKISCMDGVDFAVVGSLSGNYTIPIDTACASTGACFSTEPVLMEGRGFELVGL